MTARMKEAFVSETPTIILSREEYEIISQNSTVIEQELKNQELKGTIKQSGEEWIWEIESLPPESMVSRMVRNISGDAEFVAMAIHVLAEFLQAEYGFKLNDSCE